MYRDSRRRLLRVGWTAIIPGWNDVEGNKNAREKKYRRAARLRTTHCVENVRCTILSIVFFNARGSAGRFLVDAQPLTRGSGNGNAR
jgi:hypothetical protein